MGINKEKFRPSARLLSTIGENLIKDNYAAVVELVKNAYDADATNVSVIFKTDDDKLIITIKDDGVGMDPKTIVEKWLVPSTNDKLLRKKTAKGRFMQGEKGVGRFSAAILGDILHLKTVHKNIESSLDINWNDFADDKYLDEIGLDLYTNKTNNPNGTIFEIECDDKTKWWTEDNIEYLIKELRKMLTPVELREENDFRISLVFENFNIEKYANTVYEIEPYPLLNYFNYRIYGNVYGDGKAKLKFEYRKENEIIKEIINTKIEINKDLNYCGLIKLDFKVFERDNTNLKDCYKNDEFVSSSMDSMNINEIKRLLDRICGISIYKNDFRIRPYGDEGKDWLELDKKRVQDPSYKIGFNQISGMIMIGSEEESGLSEKSARDGLREDSYYYGFKSIITSVIEMLEAKRANLKIESKKVPTLKDTINNEPLKEKITENLQDAGVDNKVVDKIEEIIDNDTKEKEEKIDELSKNISRYQGQATLGKVMDLIMHEIRKPLMWFKTQSKTISNRYDRYLETHNQEYLDKVVGIIQDAKMQAELISDFFGKIDILATRENESKEEFGIENVIKSTLSIFDQTLSKNEITVDVDCNSNIVFYGWQKDIVMAFSNLIENSIYWIKNYNTSSKKIYIKVHEDSDNIYIKFEDTGIGISRDLLENNLLFKPGITSKPSGTGIGLTIVGNSIERNNGKVEASNSRRGACFDITLAKRRK